MIKLANKNFTVRALALLSSLKCHSLSRLLPRGRFSHIYARRRLGQVDIVPPFQRFKPARVTREIHASPFGFLEQTLIVQNEKRYALSLHCIADKSESDVRATTSVEALALTNYLDLKYLDLKIEG